MSIKSDIRNTVQGRLRWEFIRSQLRTHPLSSKVSPIYDTVYQRMLRLRMVALALSRKDVNWEKTKDFSDGGVKVSKCTNWSIFADEPDLKPSGSSSISARTGLCVRSGSVGARGSCKSFREIGLRSCRSVRSLAHQTHIL